MVKIYHYDQYKEFVKAWIQQQPNKGHGEYRRLALALGISTTMISQIFNGEKDLSLELACETSEYLMLDDDESDFFLLLVEHSKAGSVKLRSRLGKQIKERQEKAKKLENRLRKDNFLDEQAKQIYYSNWVYPAIRILVDIPEINSAEALAERLQLPKNKIMKMISFLIENKLVIEDNKKLKMGTAHIYIPPSDPLITRHHQNWRHISYQKMNFQTDDTFFYSGQFALSENVAEQIRKSLPDFVESINKTVRPSPSETIRCLNIDFFDL